MRSPAKMPSCTTARATFRKPYCHLSSSPRRAVNEEIYILIELLKVPYALAQAKWLTSIRTQCTVFRIIHLRCQWSYLARGCSYALQCLPMGTGLLTLQVTFSSPISIPFLSSSKNFPSSFMLLQINREKGLRGAEWLISFFSTLLPISSKVTVPKMGFNGKLRTR